MDNGVVKLDLVKLIKYILKRIWLPIILAAAGFLSMYFYTNMSMPDTYTASGTMYVYNANPNTLNYQYTSSNDLDSAVKLIDTYMIVAKSNKVMDVVAERLAPEYPGIKPEFIANTLSMASVSETGVVKVSSQTLDAKLSTDICNAVLDVVPEEIIRVVSAGSVEIIDYATAPFDPDYKNAKGRGIYGGLAGAVLGIVILAVFFLLNRRITDAKDLTDNYTPPILSAVKRVKRGEMGGEGSTQSPKRKHNSDGHPSPYLLNDDSPMEVMESYAKLRMNLLYTLVGKESHSVIITSAISGEGKTTVAANLAISCGRGGKKVLLVDADLRRACQRETFQYDETSKGLSEALIGSQNWRDSVLRNIRYSLDVLPAGQFPPNPAELLESTRMQELLKEFEAEYDLVLLDMPPVNIVTDPLVISSSVAGCIYVVRQNYSDHRDIRKALIAAEMTDMNVLGFAFFGENVLEGSYHSRKYYKSYYHKYDYKKNTVADAAVPVVEKSADVVVPTAKEIAEPAVSAVPPEKDAITTVAEGESSATAAENAAEVVAEKEEVPSKEKASEDVTTEADIVETEDIPDGVRTAEYILTEMKAANVMPEEVRAVEAMLEKVKAPGEATEETGKAEVVPNGLKAAETILASMKKANVMPEKVEVVEVLMEKIRNTESMA